MQENINIVNVCCFSPSSASPSCASLARSSTVFVHGACTAHLLDRRTRTRVARQNL